MTSIRAIYLALAVFNLLSWTTRSCAKMLSNCVLYKLFINLHKLDFESTKKDKDVLTWLITKIEALYISGLAIASGWNRWKIIFRRGQKAISQRLNVVAQRKPVLSTAKIRCWKPANMWKGLAFGKDLNRGWTWNSLMLVTVWSKAEKVSRAIFVPCIIKRLLASPFQNIQASCRSSANYRKR